MKEVQLRATILAILWFVAAGLTSAQSCGSSTASLNYSNGTSVNITAANSLFTLNVRSYADHDHCWWSIRCPGGSTFAITALSVDLEPGRDLLSLVDISGASRRTIDAQLDSAITGTMITNSTEVQVVLTADESVSHPTHTGFTMQFKCTPIPRLTEALGYCPSNVPSLSTGGGFNSSLLLSCPMGYRVASVLLDTTTESLTQIETALGLTTIRPSSLAQAITFASGQNVTVYWTRCGALASPPAFSLLYTCVANQACFSPNATVGNVPLAGPLGTISLPLVNVTQTCSFRIDCSTVSGADAVWITRGEGLGRLDVFSPTGKSLNGQSSMLNSELLPRPFPSTTVSIVAETRSSSSSWTFDYRCATRTCSSVNISGANYTVPLPSAASGTVSTIFGGTLVSGSHGASDSLARQLGAQENCRWNIDCPAGFFVSFENLSIDMSSSDLLEVSDSSASNATVYFRSRSFSSSSRTQRLPYVDTSSRSVVVQFATSTTIPTGTGFTLPFSCRSSDLPVRSAFTTYAPPPTTAAPPTLAPQRSLFPGSSCRPTNGDLVTFRPSANVEQSLLVNSYGNNERCRWIVVCPVGHVFITVNLSVATESCCDYVEAVTDEGAQLWIARGTVSSYALNTTADVVNVQFYTDGSVIGGFGFLLRYKCVPEGSAAAPVGVPINAPTDTPVPVPTTPTPVAGAGYCTTVHGPPSGAPFAPVPFARIESDEDGAGTRRYSNSERCAWNVYCQYPNQSVWVVYFKLNTERCCDGVTMYYPNGTRYRNTRFSGDVDWGYDRPVNLESRHVIFAFTSDGSILDTGFDLEYACMSGIDDWNALSAYRASQRAEKNERVALGVGLGLGLPLLLLILIVSYCCCCRRTGGGGGRGGAVAPVAAGPVVHFRRDSEPIPTEQRADTEMINVRQDSAWGRDLSMAMSEIDEPSRPTCIICYTYRPRYAVIPCGHVVLCQQCHERFEPQNCPVCRTHCTHGLKVTFMPRVDRGDGTTANGNCAMCGVSEAVMAPISCGHVALCEECTPSSCPVCGERIGERQRIYR